MSFQNKCSRFLDEVSGIFREHLDVFRQNRRWRDRATDHTGDNDKHLSYLLAIRPLEVFCLSFKRGVEVGLSLIRR